MRPHEIEYSVFSGSSFTDLMPYQYGREVCRPSYMYGPARRSHYLFHYIIEGEGTLTSTLDDGKQVSFPVHANEGFLIFPGQVTTYSASSLNPWEYIWVEFDGTHVRRALERVGLTKSYPIYRSQDQALRDQMYQTMQTLLDRRSDSDFYLVGTTYYFFDALIRSAEPHRTDHANLRNSFYIDTALTFVENNYQHDISVEDIARSCGINRSYFGKLFKDVMGISPQQYLIQYRMEKACDLLKLSGLSIHEVGEAVGYPNQLHFSRAFKNAMGMSPRTWRSEHVTH
ncbi:MAG TPA: AraC family transcriptional regulator [Candidatus Coprovicinus avistercoris]|uniref:AraC family transcriptional regulator n=1 Tax=Candidatus Coprovicinus avistercoris TaxID=2840754 RepID=A0A9D1HY20_9ACTN|nr:AraC family transcriptional regulator [Candidatus Coprovicinus avistercoris]